MQVTGTIRQISNVQKVTEKFSKREFVLTDSSSNYPQHILFQLTNTKCDLINGFDPGDEVTVHFNLRGREWTNPQGEIKYFNSIDCWKLEGLRKGFKEAPPTQSEPEAYNGFIPSQEPLDDLPF